MDNSLLVFLGPVVDKSAQFRVDPKGELINSALTMHWALCWREEEWGQAVDFAFIGLWYSVGIYLFTA